MATLTELQAKLADLEATADKIRNGGQGYSFGTSGRSLTRVDYAAVQKEIKELEIRIEIARNNGRIPGSHVVFGGNRG